MSDDQFRTLIDHIPLTPEGDVKYAEFMAQFDTRYHLLATHIGYHSNSGRVQ